MRVRTKVFPLPPDMKRLSPDEAERTLKEGEYFINRLTFLTKPDWMRAAIFERFKGRSELWRIVNGRAVPTGCTSYDGQNYHCPPVELSDRA